MAKGFANVIAVYKSIFTGKGASANTGNATVDKVLSSAASHPFLTAAAVATAINPLNAFAAVKTVGKAAVNAFSNAKFTTQAAVVLATPPAASLLISSQRVRDTVINYPTNSVNFAGNIGAFVDDPSVKKALEIAKENPILTGATLLAGAGVIGAATIGAGTSIANTLTTRGAIKATEKNTEELIRQRVPEVIKDIQESTASVAPMPLEPSKKTSISPAQPITPETQVIGKSAGTSVRRHKKARAGLAGNSQSLRVNIYNQTKAIYTGNSIRNR